ncbi:glycoside hydrolase [Fluviispira vulneris]|uniref:glycoside hydrolase n=1 Tax=Fluviispira vulneris TaxID=2763012 RepID=UPI001647D482|nr:glycoside hydrolase [Fluviispira vulneris]
MKIKNFIPLIMATLSHSFIFAQDKKIQFHLQNWDVEINPENLEVSYTKLNEKNTIASTLQKDLGEIANLTFNNTSAQWLFPAKQLSVSVTHKGDDLIFKFDSNKEQVLEWPNTITVKNSKNLIIPDGEGLLIPVQSLFWQNSIQKYDASEYPMAYALTLPLFGIQTENNIISYISEKSLNNTLNIKNQQNRMYAVQSHEFRKIDNFSTYEITINYNETTNPIFPSQIFKKQLIEKSQFLTLDDKQKLNPNINKLFGAMHTYVWGTGRTIEFLNAINKLGIEKMWIGTDEGENDKFKISKDYIQTAKNLGFLVGPYDTWENIQNPRTADTYLSVFPNAWPKAAVIDKKGEPIKGFHNRGYEASSQYFALQNPTNKDLKDRLNKFAETGINSYFLDVDGTGTLHDDYSPEHAMNIEQDLNNRIARMKLISEDKKLVLGSETAVYLFVPSLAFAHGNTSVFNGPHWKLTRNKKQYGAWYPTERPSFFFKSINAPTEYIKTKFNSIYRIPLFQAAFHESIITTDRWEIPITKFKNAIKDRLLLELLYGIPTNWVLDTQMVKEQAEMLKKLNAFFSPLHKKIATLPLSHFSWLTEDKLVQRTQFGDDVQLTANFSDKNYKDIPAKSIELIWLRDNKKEIFTP